jgi:hypothetical protein
MDVEGVAVTVVSMARATAVSLPPSVKVTDSSSMTQLTVAVFIRLQNTLASSRLSSYWNPDADRIKVSVALSMEVVLGKKSESVNTWR